MIRLVSDNPDPQPHRYDEFVFIDARHEAEWAQREQDEARSWSEWFAFGFACFGGGCLFTAALAWVIMLVRS
jgi:hypothetical protein